MTKRHRPKSNHTPKKTDTGRHEDHPPPEDEYGGGDFASPEISPQTDDDKPLE